METSAGSILTPCGSTRAAYGGAVAIKLKRNHPNHCSTYLFQAESECSGCVQKAVEADESNPEAWQTKARLHLVKSEFEESKSSISQSLSLWLPKYTAGVLVKQFRFGQNSK